MKPIDIGVASKSLEPSDERGTMALPASCRKYHERPQKAVGPVALQADIADQALIVGQSEEPSIGLKQIIGRQQGCVERDA